MSNAFISLTGAQLRDAIAAGTPGAQAELDRRIAKREASGKVTVAALRSWGRTTEAAAKVAAKPAKPAKVAKPKAPKADLTPVVAIPNAPKAVAFTRTHEVVADPKGAVAHLHNRLCNVEQAILKLADLQAQQSALLARLTA